VGTYLDAIVAAHRARAAADERDLEVLRADAVRRGDAGRRGFGAALRAPGLSVIAEIKRRSPSKGALNADLDPAVMARAYADGGAACLSVLTDRPHFGGSPDDLAAARAAVGLPLLRKDFTVCEADVHDAVLMGADAVLLIVAALTDDELRRFSAAAAECRLDVLVETHDEAEVERALMIGAQIIGVNQRDLHTFQVDTDRAVRVSQVIPGGVIRVAESGVRGRADATILRDAGFDAVLVGESIVTAGDPAEAVRALHDIG
jgi:indole-3-glycerol phosphate synthase